MGIDVSVGRYSYCRLTQFLNAFSVPKMKLFIGLVAGAFLLKTILAQDSKANNVVHLNLENFDSEVKNSHHFVMFYAPWCGHCQRLKPTWEVLANQLADDGNKITIAQVDCTTDAELCSQHDVTGYPTLKFFVRGTKDPIRYRGQRDLVSLTNFIAESIGSAVEMPEEKETESPKGAVELTIDNFKDHVATGDHFVKFYAPWCGHCQRLAPTWDNLAKSVEHDTSISIAKVDCTQHRALCTDFEVKGYPTLLWFKDGKKVQKYQGSRSHEDLKAFLESMKNTDKMPAKEEKVAPAATSPVVQFVESNFKNGIASGTTLVKFYAPWCGHCKRLAPTWEELAAKFVTSTSVKIAKVDCTDESNRQLCVSEKVNGFPTMFLYQDGKKVEEYDGNRSLEDLYSFVAKKTKHDEL